MLIIYSNGKTEPLQHYKELTVRERVNGEHSLSFLLLGNEEHYDLVVEESTVEYEGEQYRIKKIDERSKGHSALKSVRAQHVFFDLIDAYQYDLIGGNYTITSLLNFALTGTDFSFTVEGLTDEKLVFNYGEANVLKLVQQACELWGVEWELNNRHITVKTQIGRITDNQFRYKSNLKAIRKSVDTSKLATQIRGHGQGFHIDYTSPMSDIYGVRHAEPIRNDDISDQAVMTELLKRELNDEPNLSITVELAQLDFDAKKGDEIILIYEPLSIEMTARITEIEHYPDQPKASKVTIANFNETMSDVMTLLAKNVEKVEKKNEINRSEIRQTNEQISLEVERLEGDIATNTSSITQNAEDITLKVSETDFNGDTIIGKINLTSTTATIAAENIDLVGKVTFSDFDSSTQNTINSKVSSSSLGSLAYDDLVEQARLGSTIIQGGYIVSSLLTADNIVTGSLSADRISAGTITADVSMQSAKITTQPTSTGNYIEIGNPSEAQPTIRFYGSDNHLITTGGANLIMSTGTSGYGNIFIRSGGRTYFDEGFVDFSGADGIVWGSHGVTAKFG